MDKTYFKYTTVYEGMMTVSRVVLNMKYVSCVAYLHFISV